MPPPLLLLLDYDSTLTTTSTIPTILSLSTYPTPSPLLPSLTTAYSTDLSAHNANYLPAKATRTTLDAELAYLESLQPIEQASIERLEHSGVFRSLTPRRIAEVAHAAVHDGKVRFRPGWHHCISQAQNRLGGGSVAVISVAWSRSFISATLAAAAAAALTTDGQEQGSDIDCAAIEVRANEILPDGSGRLDRILGDAGGMWTAGGKVRQMREVIDGVAERRGKVPRTVYVGDSTTDMACWVAASVGICVRDEVMSEEQKGMEEMLRRVGMRSEWIGSWREKGGWDGDRKRERERTLWWAKGFDEIKESGLLH